MPIFALVELELHGLPEFAIGEIAQDVLGFDDTPEKLFGALMPSYSKARLSVERSPVNLRLGGGAAHAHVMTTLAL